MQVNASENSQCHITNSHDSPAPYRFRIEIVSPAMISTLSNSRIREARTGTSPSLSIRISELIVALQLRASPVYETRRRNLTGFEWESSKTVVLMVARSCADTTAMRPDCNRRFKWVHLGLTLYKELTTTAALWHDISQPCWSDSTKGGNVTTNDSKFTVYMSNLNLTNLQSNLDMANVTGTKVCVRESNWVVLNVYKLTLTMRSPIEISNTMPCK